jgi:3'(2'), 5'-bisphosphate nucleotidase
VDPLDGTKEFLKHDGKGSFTVNVAFIKDRSPVFGIVYAPALNRLFYASKSIGAFEEDKNGLKKIKIRKSIKDCIVAVASSSHQDQETIDWLEKNHVSETISIGSSLKFCLVASGEADVYPRFGPTMEWDTAAGDAILRFAGGNVENIDGTNFKYGKKEFKNTPFIAKGDF